MIKLATLELEREIWKKGYLIIGVDEVGRGALAGPVGVGAVCFNPKTSLSDLEELGIHDSKLVPTKKREELSKELQKHVLASSIVYSSVTTINTKGIVPAVHKAVREAVSSICAQLDTQIPIYLLLDAFPVKYIPRIGLQNQKAIIKGDQKSISIAAASIIAKVHRDTTMQTLGSKFEMYKWQLNKGYGTKDHLVAIKKHGPCKEHRVLYIRNVLQN